MRPEFAEKEVQQAAHRLRGMAVKGQALETVRGNPAKVYEGGINQRTVVIEFDSVQQALAAHEGAGYQGALKVLGDAAKRDMRIVEGAA